MNTITNIISKTHNEYYYQYLVSDLTVFVQAIYKYISIQYYVIKLQGLSAGLWFLRFPPPIKLTARYNWNIFESCIKHHNPNPINKYSLSPLMLGVYIYITYNNNIPFMFYELAGIKQKYNIFPVIWKHNTLSNPVSKGVIHLNVIYV